MDASDHRSLDSPPVQVEVTGQSLDGVDADLHVIGLAQEEELDPAYRELPGAEDVRGGFRKHALLRPDADRRLLVVGLGKREEDDPQHPEIDIRYWDVHLKEDTHRG